MKDTQETQEISLLEILNILTSNIWKIISTTVIGIVLAALVTFFLMTPKYTSTTDIVVNNTNTTTSENTITQAGLQANLTLLNTYQSLVSRPLVLEPAIAAVPEAEGMTAGELAENVTVSMDSDSLLFTISVENESPFMAANLANAIAASFSEVVKDVLQVENVAIVTPAAPSEAPTSPNILLNLIIGGLLGLIIGVVYQFIKAMLDNSVKSSDIIEELDWTLLGTIPEMNKSKIDDTRFKATATSDGARHRRRV
ncbi:chain length-determining protein [Aerococcus agrisoli]|uniref:Capsular polysaccharide biosynthesis protein CpsC n=1 Tax=Aerococcus agrisoli TaxID=2487350 RepID=A0A3N4G110_9LACT|nr:Wzz/FepE/Etk N-terminal domain-containing protein [Aerococcus agrisoli]RPA55968.1 chain length-determining protein [Aerococcus agrisoli]